MTITDCWDVTVRGQGGRYRQKVPLTHWYPPTKLHGITSQRPQPRYSLPRNSEILMCIMLKKGTSFLSHLFYLTSRFAETQATLRSWVKRVGRIVVPSYFPGLLEPSSTHPETLIQHSVTAQHTQILSNSARRTSQSCKQVTAGNECTCNLTFCEGIFMLKWCNKIHY